MKWRIRMEMNLMMTVMRLTNTVSWRTAWVQHSKHAERWQPQWGVPLPRSYPLSQSSLPNPWVSHTGSTSRAPLGVAWNIHCPGRLRALQLKVWLKIQNISQSDKKALQSSQQVWAGPRLQEMQLTEVQSFLGKSQSSGCLCMSRRAPRSTEQDWEENADRTDTLITMQQLPGLLLHLNTLSLFLSLPVDTPSLHLCSFLCSFSLCSRTLLAD